MLQERISELGSGILQIKDNKAHLTGFMNPERLADYYEQGIDCHLSDGIYSNTKLDWGKIKDNALFIILNNESKEVCRYQFIVMQKETIKYKDSANKLRTRTYIIRKCRFSNQYNFKIEYKEKNNAIEKEIKEVNKTFDSLVELSNFFKDFFGLELQYTEK